MTPSENGTYQIVKFLRYTYHIETLKPLSAMLDKFPAKEVE
jgi:hypothetical protein